MQGARILWTWPTCVSSYSRPYRPHLCHGELLWILTGRGIHSTRRSASSVSSFAAIVCAGSTLSIMMQPARVDRMTGGTVVMVLAATRACICLCSAGGIPCFFPNGLQYFMYRTCRSSRWLSISVLICADSIVCFYDLFVYGGGPVTQHPQMCIIACLVEHSNVELGHRCAEYGC